MELSIKKQLGLAFAAVALGAMLIAAGTFALFTDTATNSGNTFTAGTVDIDDVTGGAAFSSSSFISNLAPGDSENETLTINNVGTLDAWVQVHDAVTSGDLFSGPTPLVITYDNTPVLIPAGGSATVNVGYNFPLAADNSYQGDTGSVDFQIQAVQARNNTNGTNTGPNSWN